MTFEERTLKKLNFSIIGIIGRGLVFSGLQRYVVSQVDFDLDSQLNITKYCSNYFFLSSASTISKQTAMYIVYRMIEMDAKQ